MMKSVRDQYVKELPNGEIELHGETETYQYHPSRICGMQIRYEDGGIHRIIHDGETIEPYWILVVISGHASEYSSEERIVFTAPTEEGVEAIRAQINEIRYAPKCGTAGIIKSIKNKLRGTP